MGIIQKTAIIVPCFNEEQRLIPEKFFNYIQKNEDVVFLFVDDGSTDNTKFILSDMCACAPSRLEWRRLDKNVGKAGAVRQGVLTALDYEFDAIGYLDADLSAPLECINDLLKCLEDPHIKLAMGSRVLLLGHKIRRQVLRHYLGRFFGTAASLVLGLSVYDTQCGAKLFRNDVTLKQVFSDPFFARWIFDVEILARMMVIHKYSGLPALSQCVLEYPLKEWQYASGSKIKLRDGFCAGFELLKIWLFRYSPGLIPHYQTIHARYQRAGHQSPPISA
jgi:glycosyltransferase involved in cell wall biosynthesis